MENPQITLAQLKSYLWVSAKIVRSPLDAADFKAYSFSLLSLRGVCDVTCKPCSSTPARFRVLPAQAFNLTLPGSTNPQFRIWK